MVKPRIVPLVIGLVLLLLVSPQRREMEEDLRFSGAGKAMDEWTSMRAYPFAVMKTSRLEPAYLVKEKSKYLRNNDVSEWTAIGPKNIGGRTLCLAFHPSNPDVMYAGSASGGLWRTQSRGVGINAWQHISIGFPVLGVSSIAINPDNPNEIYIGTGEVYNDISTMPGIYNRLTRGTYGIGILKSTDGGKNWEKSLDWAYEDMRGVQEIEIDRFDSQIVYAATTAGFYRSVDAGANWELLNPTPMAVDIEQHHVDTNLILVSFGSLEDEAFSGIYRSEDRGLTLTKITEGLPHGYSGKGLMTISRSNSNVIYASVANWSTGLGLFRSDDRGRSWYQVNGTDVPQWQGWYSHDVAVHPEDHEEVLNVGIDVYKSDNGGESLSKKSFWDAWDLGRVPIGGPEGLAIYVHADIHQAYYHPLDPDQVYFATDGGIFMSGDGAQSFAGRNGGYQTTQFYANFSNSTTDPDFAMGGMQDNATAIYDGSGAWIKVIGGDGMSTAIHPLNDQILYGSYQNLGLMKSINRGASFNLIRPDQILQEARSFNAPFELQPWDPNVVLAGGQRLYISEDGGENWRATHPDPIDKNNTIITIASSEIDPTIIYVSTAPTGGTPPNLFKSGNGGANWQKMMGMPDRIITDIVINPIDPNVVYVTISGFQTRHLYWTVDGGSTWEPLGEGLPDLPTNSLALDPFEPDHMYIGNDMGVYFSADGGHSWSPFVNGLPDAIIAMDVTISEPARKIRVATHGSGVFESRLVSQTTSTEEITLLAGAMLEQNAPNPVRDHTQISWNLPTGAKVRLDLTDVSGRLLNTLVDGTFSAGKHNIDLELGTLPQGLYFYTLSARSTADHTSFVQTRKLLKF